MRWDAARAASERRERKYVECGPVGRKHGLDVTRDDGEAPSCRACGFHVCSCERQQLKFVGGGEMLPMRVSEKHTAKPCESCGLRSGAHFTDCPALHATAQGTYREALDESDWQRGVRENEWVFLEHGIRTGDFTAFEPHYPEDKDK